MTFWPKAFFHRSLGQRPVVYTYLTDTDEINNPADKFAGFLPPTMAVFGADLSGMEIFDRMNRIDRMTI